MSWDEVLLTDLSALSDFSSCGLPNDIETVGTLTSLYDAWDDAWGEWVIPKIEDVFGVKVDKTTILLVDLVDLFDRIEKQPSLSLRHSFATPSPLNTKQKGFDKAPELTKRFQATGAVAFFSFTAADRLALTTLLSNGPPMRTARDAASLRE